MPKFLEVTDKGLARTAISAADGSGLVDATDGQTATISDGKLIAGDPIYIDPTAAPYFIRMDRFTTGQASMSATVNPTRLTVGNYTFTDADAGKVIKVVGAGSAGGNLKTTIVGASAGNAVLADPCLTTVSNANAIFGTDNATALNQLFTDISAKTAPRPLSRIAVFPSGGCMFSGTLLFPRIGTVKGAAENYSNDSMIYNFAGVDDFQTTVFYQIWDQNVDCARVRDYWEDLVNPRNWIGKLEGFIIEQDVDNSDGRGLSFRNAQNNPVSVIDGGIVTNVAVYNAARDGFDFADGVTGNGVISHLWAFGCGYMGRKVFTANSTAGSAILTGVSSTVGLASGDILYSEGLPLDSVISSVDSDAGTVTMMAPATATATGITVEKGGDPGIRYTMHGWECAHLFAISGDCNSGGTLRLEGQNYAATGNITITQLKNEFGPNIIREGKNVVTNPSVPQGQNAIVLDRMQYNSVNVRGLTHWGTSRSSTGGPTPNALGRHLGAAILVLPTFATGSEDVVTDVNWDALSFRIPAGSTQTKTVAFRDVKTGSEIEWNTFWSGHGSSIPARASSIRKIADTNAQLTPVDCEVGWTSLTATRSVTLPPLNKIPEGHTVVVRDLSGSASSSVNISAFGANADQIRGDSNIATAYAALRLVKVGSQWVSSPALAVNRTLTNPRINSIKDSTGATLLNFIENASAANFLQIENAAAGQSPGLFAIGSDTNIDIRAYPKNAGVFGIFSPSGQTSTVAAQGGTGNLNLVATGNVLINGLQTDSVLVHDSLASGESTMSRRLVSNQSVATTNRTLRFTYFTARKSETITRVRTINGATANVGATLCRIGIYSVASNGNLTLIASIVNDTSLWASTANTAFTRDLSNSFNKVRGQRYAVGILVVGATTAPTMCGQVSLIASESGQPPRLGALLANQDDLPNTVSNGDLGDNGNLTYTVLLPAA